MRIAAVAFVLIVGAAIVLAFANTLNSWVLGGLLGGLAAILLCIPISLAIFMVLTRRHEARQRTEAEAQAEIEHKDELYEDELMVYEAEGYALPIDEEQLLLDERAYYAPDRPRIPVSGYLALPPAGREIDFYAEDEPEMPERHDPRNYPRQPRHPARALTPRDEIGSHQAPTTGQTRHPSTRSLAQHQSAALRRARQEALQQQRPPQKNGGSASLGGRAPGNRPPTRRSRTSHLLRGQESIPERYRPEDDYETRQPSKRSAWQEDDFASHSSTEGLDEHYPQYPRRPRTHRARASEPWTGDLDEQQEQWEAEPRLRRAPRDPDRISGNLRNPLVRRAPYLYEDDPLNEEFSRQLDNDHPITRRSSRYDPYRENEQK